ncbi:relaxase/mobilization nuclease [Streptomyces murinus]|uniref:relaxase/mobilization nuclease n=1 Tax=Streptomyces murinus TaxID=33900 RepID=UPI0037F343BB
MIPRLHERVHAPHDPLTEALGCPVSPGDGPIEQFVVAHWPGLDHYTVDRGQKTWSCAQWAEHLDDAYLEHPFATGPGGTRRAIWHLQVRLHPDDRDLARGEWAEVAHRFARAAGLEVPGVDGGCRWLAVQARPGRLDLIASLVRFDGTWQQEPAGLAGRLATEARRIERDLRLVSPPTALGGSGGHAATRVADQLAAVLAQLADERSGPLAAVRTLVEHTACRAAIQSGIGPAAAHDLELIAQRLHRIQQDLDEAALRLTAPLQTPTATPAPRAWGRTSRNSP